MSPCHPLATLRILDANANRAAEGLRVVEDHARFALNDAHLTRLCKTLRHDLTAALSVLPPAQLHAARDTQADAGTTISTSGESPRTSPQHVVQANWNRVQQALRTLEEYGKLISPELGAKLEALRYRSYTLERAFTLTTAGHERLASARLYVLTDAAANFAAFTNRVTQLVQAGVHVIQLRAKDLSDRQLLEYARELRRLTRDSGTLFVMNDRADLAVLAQADGVHVGQSELALPDVRSLVGANMLIGVSTHNLEQARAAVLAGANYLGVGPLFPSSTKAFAAFPGLDFARQVAAEISLPAFAIGGITLANLPNVLATGLTRVAVSQAICAAPEPGPAAAAFLQRL